MKQVTGWCTCKACGKLTSGDRCGWCGKQQGATVEVAS